VEGIGQKCGWKGRKDGDRYMKGINKERKKVRK
jgi:hypothetical protein